MIDINEIRKCVLDGDYEISYHAEIERGIDKITNSQIDKSSAAPESPDPDRWEDGYKKRRKIGT